MQHNYLWSVAVDPADPDTIIISSATSPAEAHGGQSGSRSFIYRKQAGEAWRRIEDGLSEAKGTIVPILASNKNEPGVFYALSNKGLYRSPDTGLHWERITLPWKPEYERQHPQALVVDA